MGPTARPTENNVFPASNMPLANAVYSTVFWPTCRPFCSPEYIVPPSVCLCIYYNDGKYCGCVSGSQARIHDRLDATFLSLHICCCLCFKCLHSCSQCCELCLLSFANTPKHNGSKPCIINSEVLLRLFLATLLVHV